MRSAATVTKEATGKVVLLGEHSVVYGQPAIATVIDRKLRVVLWRRGVGGGNGGEHGPSASGTGVSGGDGCEGRLGGALARAAMGFGLPPDELRVRVESNVPAASGLGSSAALSVALIRAAAELAGAPAPSRTELAARAAEIENVFHGTSSGVDVAAVASGGTIWFERGGPRTVSLRVAESVELVVSLSGELRSTGGPVGRLRDRVRTEPELYARLFGVAGEVVRRGAEALAHADWQALGALFDLAHGLLNACGVSTPTLERMIAIARSAGAVGAKLTGAGGGGAIVALAPCKAERVVAALASEGFEAFATRLPKQGTDVAFTMPARPPAASTTASR